MLRQPHPAAFLARPVRCGGRLSLMACLLITFAAPAPASVKPCRAADGKVIPCAKAPPKRVDRCKDASGKFIKCPTDKAGAAKPK